MEERQRDLTDEQQRELTLVLEQVTGMINRFYAFVNGKRVIAGDGPGPREWTGNVPDETRIKFRVTGIDDAQYKAKIDLPGDMQDQELTFNLRGGYHEWEIRI